MVQEYVAESVRTVVSERIMPSFRDVEISVASLGNKAGLWGAVIYCRTETENTGNYNSVSSEGEDYESR